MRSLFRSCSTLLALSLTAGTVFGQGQDETLLRGGLGSVGWYVAPVVKLTEISNRGEAMGGIRAGVLFSRRFGVGLAAYGGGQAQLPVVSYSSTYPPPPAYGYRGREEAALEYGGLELEYIWQPSKLVHATVTTLIGGGSMASDLYYPVPLLESNGRHRGDYPSVPRDGFFVAEPAANVEVNVAKHVRLGVGLGYRFTAGGERYSSAPTNARGATGSFTIRFGKL